MSLFNHSKKNKSFFSLVVFVSLLVNLTSPIYANSEESRIEAKQNDAKRDKERKIQAASFIVGGIMGFALYRYYKKPSLQDRLNSINNILVHIDPPVKSN